MLRNIHHPVIHASASSGTVPRWVSANKTRRGFHMDEKLLARTLPTRALPLVAAAIVLSLAAHPAAATQLNSTDTVTYSGGVVVTAGGAATSVMPTVSYNLGGAFNGAPIANDFPNPPAMGSGGPWNFYDDYVFTIGGAANIQTAVISFSSGIAGISDLQGRISSTSTPYSAAVAASNLSNPPSSGSVVEEQWTTDQFGSSGFYTVTLNQQAFAPGTYDLQIRGEVDSSKSGSYGGSVSFTPVPLPAALPLLLSGLGLFGAAARRVRGRLSGF
jgi:hypothetical protein